MASHRPYAIRRVDRKTGVVLASRVLRSTTIREAQAAARVVAAALTSGEQIVQLWRDESVVASFERTRRYSRKRGAFFAAARKV